MSGTLVFTKIVEFVLIAILTRIVSTQGYGEYSLFNSWVNILSIVIGGSIGSSFGIAKKDFKEHYSRYLASCVGLSYLFLAIAFVIGFVINESWDVYYLGLIILHSFNSNTLSNYDVMLIFDEKFVKASLINILKSVFFVCSYSFRCIDPKKPRWRYGCYSHAVYQLYGIICLCAD